MRTTPNCKINIGLQVMRRREDGYHDLETIFVPVPLCDNLTINVSDIEKLSIDGIPIESDAEHNLVMRAYRLMQQEFGDRIPKCDISLTKNIPTGAGLGGGSSDAAFTIKMINDAAKLHLNNTEMELLAARLGADCAFFINNRTAYATGIGDRLTPLAFNPIKGYKLVMVKPDESVSTAEAYRGILPRDRRDDLPTCNLAKAIERPIKEWNGLIVNDFEETVFKSHPNLAKLKDALYSHGALYAAMSGSGATIYGIFDNNQDTDINFNANCNVYTFNL